MRKELSVTIGYIDHSTNDIIVDAVLTDTGRNFISRNDGSFAIHKFAFSDDEVNYGIIPKYGRTVGKEKIEKNTPIFQALTVGAQAQKYKLTTISNPYLIRLPVLSLTGIGSSSNVISMGFRTSDQRTQLIRVEQTIQDESSIPVDLVDSIFMIEVSNLFLQVAGNRPENVDSQQRASYIVNSSSENSQKGAIVQFTISLKSITDALFTVYGSTSDKTVISTYVRVTGLVSGAVKEFTVNINKG